MMRSSTFYEELASQRDDQPELRECVGRVVECLLGSSTSAARPGILLGKVQAGKTRAFLGVIAAAFDRGYDGAIILTKGTRSLAKQTLKRVDRDFTRFRARDLVQYFDIMSPPPNLTPYELGQRLVIIAKKEDDNLRHLHAFFTQYQSVQKKKWLIVDDEADFASVSFRKRNGEASAGVLSQSIDALRQLLARCDYLQVTATPYSLYLQPEDEVTRNGVALFLPKRPSFTVLLPTHGGYVGGDYYFEKRDDESSPAYYFYEEVPLQERDALKAEDRRRLKIENVLSEHNTAVLRIALMNFVVGGVLRRLDQGARGEPMRKYSFLFHTEQARASHDWQERIVIELRDQLQALASTEPKRVTPLIVAAYEDLRQSLCLLHSAMPTQRDVIAASLEALSQGYLMVTKVNSDEQIDRLLDDEGELRLRTPLNLFIGGQILDRGITITNLIGFYYGRNPRRFQQDTVLQHSRMYGARSMDDLAVTRFYAPMNVYRVMERINDFDRALRSALESRDGADRGVYFIRRDGTGALVPTSPNKLMFSEVRTLSPTSRLLPLHFQTLSITAGKKVLADLDRDIANLAKVDGTATQIELSTALKLLKRTYSLLEFADEGNNNCDELLVALEHLSTSSPVVGERGKVWLLTERDRDIARFRAGGRFSNAPDSKQQALVAEGHAVTLPVLELLRQNGTVEKEWRGLSFWWPVVVVPSLAANSIYAERVGRDPS